jgi:hypothetical protein
VTNIRDITKLTWPFPQSVIKAAPKGGAGYVPHSVVEQRLLRVLGPPTTRLVEVVRGPVEGKAPNPKSDSAKSRAGYPALPNAVVAVVLEMSAEVDGRHVTVTEVGDVGEPHNWPTDGARLKDAFSDAYKRCAMRLGVGLHLWCKDGFMLHEGLQREDESNVVGPVGDEAAGIDEEPPEDPDAPTEAATPDRPGDGESGADPVDSPETRRARKAEAVRQEVDAVIAATRDLAPGHCSACGKPFGTLTLKRNPEPGSKFVHEECP